MELEGEMNLDSNVTSAEIARKHKLNEEDTEKLTDLVLTHLLVCSAGGLLEIKEDEDLSDQLEENQRKLDGLMETTAKPILMAFEEFLREQLKKIEAKSAA